MNLTVFCGSLTVSMISSGSRKARERIDSSHDNVVAFPLFSFPDAGSTVLDSLRRSDMRASRQSAVE